MRLVILGAALASVGVALVAPAGVSGDPGSECAGALDPDTCLAVATRLDTLVGKVDALEGSLQSPGVALEPSAMERLDLAWWGAWAIVGLLLALIVAPLMQHAFRWWRE